MEPSNDFFLDSNLLQLIDHFYLVGIVNRLDMVAGANLRHREYVLDIHSVRVYEAPHTQAHNFYRHAPRTVLEHLHQRNRGDDDCFCSVCLLCVRLLGSPT